jgi:hypothetical protein
MVKISSHSTVPLTFNSCVSSLGQLEFRFHGFNPFFVCLNRDFLLGAGLPVPQGHCSGPQSTYFPRDETGLVCLPTQLERTLQLYW